MSETPPPYQYIPPPSPPQRHGCVVVLMVVIGVILLLPGLCAIIFGGMALTEKGYDPGFTPFIMFGLLVGFGGVMLIRAAIKGPSR
jgi:hypothetical protein